MLNCTTKGKFCASFDKNIKLFYCMKDKKYMYIVLPAPQSI